MMLELAEKYREALKKREKEMPSFDKAITPEVFWYTDPTFFNFEKESVFKKSWQYVGRLDQLVQKGDYFSGEFLGLPYIVIKNEEKSPRAFYNICSHHASLIVDEESSGNKDCFQCPYHGWTYGVKGDLNKIPGCGSLKGLNVKQLGLKEIPLKVKGPFIFLYFGSLKGKGEEEEEDFFPSELLDKKVFDGMSFVGRFSYSLKCNWKVFVDNYLDGGYHVPWMHPGLSDQVNFDSYKTNVYENYSVQSCLSKEGGEEGLRKKCDLDFPERVGKSARYFWMYPNFMVNIYGQWVDTNWVKPIKEDECLVYFDYFYKGFLSDELKQKSLNASFKVQEEDTVICERVQKGLSSGVYNPGPYVPKYEYPMFSFHQKLLSSYQN
ncbi:MAG: hypothetical protein CME68_10105 [Halobacteriovoraceae bacterium]|nr:hypothetical protein [Halobacteriovoraceae bacterium]